MKLPIDFRNVMILSLIAGAVIIYFNFLIFSEIPQIFAILNMAAFISIIGIPLIYKYVAQKRSKKIESIFPKFLSDIIENINTGMTLPQAIRTVSVNDYGAMTPYVKEMDAKISLGITFETTLKNFAKKVRSDVIKRNIYMIIETHRSGGTVSSVLSAVVESMEELEKIRKQRMSSVYTQVLNGYIIYIIFLGIMVALSSFLLPTFQIGTVENLKSTLTEIFISLIIIQGVFSGLAIGKMSEGTILAGAKHSLIMVAIGYSAFIIFG